MISNYTIRPIRRAGLTIHEVHARIHMRRAHLRQRVGRRTVVGPSRFGRGFVAYLCSRFVLDFTVVVIGPFPRIVIGGFCALIINAHT